jgi:hypothetical protein
VTFTRASSSAFLCGLRALCGEPFIRGEAAKESQRANGKSEKPYVQKSLAKKQEFTGLQCSACGPAPSLGSEFALNEMRGKARRLFLPPRFMSHRK